MVSRPALLCVAAVLGCGSKPAPRSPEPPPLEADAYAHYLRGRIAVIEGNSELARKAFSVAANAAPDQPEIVVAYVQALIDTHRRETAARLGMRARQRWPDRADVALVTGSALRRSRKYALALSHLTHAHRLDPDLEEATHELALNLVALQKPGVADRVLHEATRRSPRSTALRMRLARLRADRGDAAGAEPVVREVLTLRPSYTRARVLHAQLLRALGRRADAIATLREGFTLSGARPRVGERLFFLLMDAGDHAAAVELLGALDEPSLSEGVRIGFGYLLVRADRAQLALRLARRLGQAFSSPAALELEAFALARLGRFEEAAAVALKVDGDPEPVARSRRFAVEMLALAGRGEEAIAMATRAGPDDPRWQVVLARAHELAGDAATARATLAAARARWPDEADLTLATASFELRDGRSGTAIALAERLLREHPGNAALQNFVGFALADAGVRLDTARELLSKALAASPDDVNIIDSYGWMLYRTGKTEKAARYLRRAWRLSPAEPEILFHLARIEEALGRAVDAGRRYRKALSLASEPSLRRRIEARLKQTPAPGSIRP